MSEQELTALVAEATKRSGMLWLDYAGGGWPRPAWHVWLDDVAYVVSGGSEQPLPVIEQAREAKVTVRSKDNQGRLVTWEARLEVVPPESDGWEVAAKALAAERLNGTGPESTLSRWKAESTIMKLVPTGKVLEAPGQQPDDSHAKPPVETRAATRGPLPRVLHRRPKRAPRL